MDKEYDWLKKRCGRITASELHNLTSASGRLTDGNLAYIRGKRWERRHGYALPVFGKAMDLGNETEPEIFKWAVANLNIEGKRFIYSKDLDEIPIWVAPDMPFFSASPDAYSDDRKIVLEFKTLVGNEPTEFYMDPYTDSAEKRSRSFKEHGDQVLGLFLSNPEVERVILIKYAPQRDDIIDDTDSPLAPWRGEGFKYEREELLGPLVAMAHRIRLVNAMIDSQLNPSGMKTGWDYDEETGSLVEVSEKDNDMGGKHKGE